MKAMRRALNLRLACQAMALKVSANLVVQLVTCWGSADKPFDVLQVVEFAFYGMLGSQIGNAVQFILEDWFPTGTAHGGEVLPDVMGPKKDDTLPRPGEKAAARRKRWFSISPDIIWRNVLAKLVLDQTAGLLISATTFLVCTSIARVPHPLMVVAVVRAKLWPLIKAGWHIWPLVAVCNFLWVPVRSRVLVAVCVGFGWSIFLTIFVMRSEVHKSIGEGHGVGDTDTH